MGKEEETKECKIPRRIRIQTPSNIFEKQDVENFALIYFFDIANNYMLVTATDNIFLLHIFTLEETESSEWAPNEDIKEQCMAQRNSEDECRNHIKVLHVLKGNIFICGTYANNPSCNWRGLRSLPTIEKSVNGYEKAPFTSTHSVTSVLTEDESLYVGTSLDASGSSWGIIKSSAKSSHPGLSTKVENSWLWSPSFVSSFEHENHVYFLFNEKAIEASSSGKISYPRMARVCKKDPGSKASVPKNIWVTFQKARIECSKPGLTPFYFNYLKSVVFLPKENIFYGLFTTVDELGITGSAVCVYSMNSVNKTFNGKFAYNNAEECEKEKTQEEMENFNCQNTEMNKEKKKASPRTFKYHLMNEFIKPDDSFPLISSDFNRLHFMDVAVVPTAGKKNIHIVFLADDNGLVSKLSILSDPSKENSKTSCLLDVFLFSLYENGQIILTMKYLDLTKSLYFGTKEKLLRINVTICERFQNEKSCLSSGDPHCGWNTKESKCTIAPNNNPSDSTWKQNELVCPPPSFEDKTKLIVPEYESGGDWSMWSKWQNCSTERKSRKKRNCLFRERTCRPGGKCSGVRVQVQGSGRKIGISVQKVFVFPLLAFLMSQIGTWFN